jgi:hypothetical protein
MLLLMLGAVLVLMRQLEQPETATLLGRVFSSPANNEPDRAGKASVEASEKAAISGDSEKLASDPAWAAVKDNALFQPAEHDAWFLLWDEVRHTTPAELERRAIGEVTYAQLVNQPDVYRGQPVRIRGRVLRESVKAAPKNSLGITDYHRLIIAPVGGGDWPVMVYCLDLPPGFPRGDGLKEDVAITGLFFKNWSYAYDGGMGLAPVLVTRSFDWGKPVRARATVPPSQVSAKGVWIGGGLAMVVATGFILWVARQTRRPRHTESPMADLKGLRADS